MDQLASPSSSRLAWLRLSWGPGRFISLTLAAGLLIGGVIIGWQALWPGPRIPQSYARQMLYPVYMPTRLPAGYAIDQSSYQVHDQALIFVARTESGRQIVISEQAKPTDFDFHSFYQQQLIHATMLTRLPYSSVLGTPISGGAMSLLSVPTDSTWIIITSQHSLSEADCRTLVAHLRKQ